MCALIKDSETPKRKRDKDATQQALLESAIQVFSQRGYDAATTREIAERAGVSEALIQRYFQGKAGLLQSIIGMVAAQDIEEEHANLPLPDKLEDEVYQILQHQCEDGDRNAFIRVVLSRALVDAELGKLLGSMVHERKLPVLKTRLMHYQKKGEIAAGADLNAVATCISGMGFALGFMGPEVFEWDRARLKEISAYIAKVISQGLKLPSR